MLSWNHLVRFPVTNVFSNPSLFASASNELINIAPSSLVHTGIGGRVLCDAVVLTVLQGVSATRQIASNVGVEVDVEVEDC